MVDTTPAEVCEDPVVFIIKTATNMTAYKMASQYRELYKQRHQSCHEISSKSCDKPTVRVIEH